MSPVASRERFGALRALLQRPASALAWRELCQLYASLPDGELTEQEQHYIDQHLSRWPDHVPREAEYAWLTFHGTPPHAHPLLRWSNTLHLDWDITRDTSRLTARFASHPRLFDELHTLTMKGAHLTMRETSILLLQPYARTLRLLALQGPTLSTDDAITALTSLLNTNLPHLEHLLVANTSLRPGVSARRLLQSPSGRALRSLDLSSNHLGAGAGELLQQGLSTAHHLESLALAEADLTHHAMAGLAMALRQAHHLRRLDLFQNLLDEESLCELFELAAGSQLEELYLAENATGVSALNTLARSFPALRKLSLNLPPRQHHLAAELDEEMLDHPFDHLEHLILGDNAAELWGFLFEDRDAFPGLTHLSIHTLPRHEDQIAQWVEDILDLGLEGLEILDLKLCAPHLDALEALHHAHAHFLVRVMEIPRQAELLDELCAEPWAEASVQRVPLSGAPLHHKLSWM